MTNCDTSEVMPIENIIGEWKCCQPVFSPLLTMFSTQLKDVFSNISFFMCVCVQFGKGLRDKAD